MNYANIKTLDVANGEGIRVSLFVSGCTHHCPECFNAEAGDFNYGEEYTPEVEQKVLDELGRPMVEGLSLLGGEPFEPCNQRVLIGLLRRAKALYPEKNVWCFSGYLYDKELKAPSRARCEVTDEMLSYIDFLVDGRFEKDKKNLRLRFRGSANQRIIDLRATEAAGCIVPWEGLAEEQL
jgi:anaerobic ribonucleoside-triphosphate reductase activating protein